MKKILSTALLVAMTAGAVSAGQSVQTFDRSIYDYIDNINDNYNQADAGQLSHIDIHGAYGNDFHKRDVNKALIEIQEEIAEEQGANPFKIYNYTRRNEDSHDNSPGKIESTITDKDTERDHVEYVVKNGTRKLIIAELGDTNNDYSIAFTQEGTSLHSWASTEERDNLHAKTNMASSQASYDKTIDSENRFGDMWAPRLVVESNYNSKRYFDDVQNFDKIGSNIQNVADDDTKRMKIWELDVEKVGSNEQAKQVIAATAAVMFNKFENITGNDAKDIIWNSSVKKAQNYRQFQKNTIKTVLSPMGNLN